MRSSFRKGTQRILLIYRHSQIPALRRTLSYTFPHVKIAHRHSSSLGRGNPSLVCLIFSHLYLWHAWLPWISILLATKMACLCLMKSLVLEILLPWSYEGELSLLHWDWVGLGSQAGRTVNICSNWDSQRPKVQGSSSSWEEWRIIKMIDLCCSLNSRTHGSYE